MDDANTAGLVPVQADVTDPMFPQGTQFFVEPTFYEKHSYLYLATNNSKEMRVYPWRYVNRLFLPKNFLLTRVTDPVSLKKADIELDYANSTILPNCTVEFEFFKFRGGIVFQDGTEKRTQFFPWHKIKRISQAPRNGLPVLTRLYRVRFQTSDYSVPDNAYYALGNYEACVGGFYCWDDTEQTYVFYPWEKISKIYEGFQT